MPLSALRSFINYPSFTGWHQGLWGLFIPKWDNYPLEKCAAVSCKVRLQNHSGSRECHFTVVLRNVLISHTIMYTHLVAAVKERMKTLDADKKKKENLLSLCENLFGCHLVKAGVSFKSSPNPFKSLALYKVVNPRTACFLTSSSLLTRFTSKTHFGCVFQVPRGFLEMARCQGLTTTSSALETSGSWKRADFCWRVEPMMVGTGTPLGIWDTGTHFCTPFTVTAPYNGWIFSRYDLQPRWNVTRGTECIDQRNMIRNMIKDLLEVTVRLAEIPRAL